MIFLDSSFIVGYKIENDEHHEKAVRLIKEISAGAYGVPVISDYVFDESVTVVFGRVKKLSAAIELGEHLKESANIVWINEEIFEEAWKLFKEQKDTSLSFTDCTIVSVMRKTGIQNIATFDEDFKKIKGVKVAG